jgi:hypothetical protein
MTGARMEISGREETLAFLGATIEKTDDQRGLFDAIGMALVVSTQQRFEDETDPQSITHAPTDNSVAIGTNLIYAAIHQTGGTIKAKTAKGLRFRGPGNGGWVQKSEVTIPQRAFLGVDDEDENEIRALCADWLGAVDENGGGANAGR